MDAARTGIEEDVAATRIAVVVLAHNEERRIADCLASLPRADGVALHVVVNGSSDRTAAIARGFDGAAVHEYREGGKSRSWNRFVLDTMPPGVESYVFVDGDAEIAPGSIDALVAALKADRHANAAAGLPLNGRRAAYYRDEIRREHAMFGDLYALRGSFVDRMRAGAVRLPDDLIGDDGLIGALAKTDLRDERHWDDGRLLACDNAGFLCEPTRLSAASLAIQYRRMINYSVRHFQNRIISHVMRNEGPHGLPDRLADLYPRWLPSMRPRRSPVWWWFDRLALRRMARAAGPSPTSR